MISGSGDSSLIFSKQALDSLGHCWHEVCGNEAGSHSCVLGALGGESHPNHVASFSLPCSPTSPFIIYFLSSGATHELLFDYGGFPKETYEYKYPAKGDPKLVLLSFSPFLASLLLSLLSLFSLFVLSLVSSLLFSSPSLPLLSHLSSSISSSLVLLLSYVSHRHKTSWSC